VGVEGENMLVFGTCLWGLLMQGPVAEAPADAWRAEKLVTVKPKAPAVEGPAEAKPQPPQVKPTKVKKAAKAKSTSGAGASRRGPVEEAPVAEANEVDSAAEAVTGEVEGGELPASEDGKVVVDGMAGEPQGAVASAPPVTASTAAVVDVSAEESAGEGERCELGPVLTTSEVDPVRLRKGRAQMFAGAGLLGVGVVGLGVMVSGSYIQRFSAHELARGTGYSDEALAPLRAQHARGETMLAAGAVTAAFGAVLGVTLLATGARDVRAARGRVQVAPTLGGLVLSGRF
jgi:hypothetical protein